MKKFARVLAPVLALSLAASLFTGCGSKAEETQAAATETKAEAQADAKTEDKADDAAASEGTVKDTLIIATANETPSLTTNLHNAVAGDYMNEQTHSNLFKVDPDMNIVPDVVESYENPSDTEWIFKIYEGIKFHNGMEMTAHDVKASLELCKESPEVAQYGESSKEIEVIDDYTIKITTDGPQSGLLSDLTHHGNCILPKELIESGHDFNKEPIGSGAYKVVEWNKGESIVLEAFDEYFGEPAKIKNMIWKIIPEGSSRTMALEAGEVDLIVEVETTDVSRMMDNSDITVFNEAGTSHNFMMINNEKAPFDNINFRKAIASAIDKQAIVQVAFNGSASPVDAMVPDCFPGATAEGAPTYDVEAAKAYLEASGLNPAECGFPIICSNDTKLRAGQVIQSCLKENLGIEVTLESMDLATYLDVTATGDYMAAIGGYTSSDMLSYAKGVYHSSGINASNKTRTNEPEIDALIEEMQATLDPAANAEVVTRMSIAVNENCPQVPLWMENNTRAYNANLKGFNVNAGGGTDYSLFSW